MSRGDRWSLYAGVFLVTCAVLLLQVTLTRVFAVMLWHHFAYMVVSLSLLGLGAAGSLLTATGAGERRRAAAGKLAAYATSFGISTAVAFLLVTRIRIDSLELWKDLSNFWGLLAIYLLCAIPFIFAGLVLASAFSWYPERAGRIYCVDLLGSAAGAVIAPAILGRVQAPAAVMIAAAIALLAGSVFAFGGSSRSRILTAVGAVAGVAVAVGFAGGGLGMPALSWEVPFAPHKGFPGIFFTGRKSETTLPSAVAQVDVSAPRRQPMIMGGNFGIHGQQVVPMRAVTQDGTAPTALYENGAAVQSFPALGSAQAASAFVATRARGDLPEDVLVIGVGGGIDVMMALYHGAERVTAVEINRAMVDMVTERYADYIGHLFDDPRIDLVLEDGRSYLRRTDRRFDVIQLSGVDTYTALASGAYTLSESYLYTVEAIEEMYSRLRPGGIINYSRFLLTAPRKPRESVRLANLAHEALSRRGVEEPWRHVAVLQAAGWASTMIRKEPFEPAEIEALRRFADEEHFLGLVHDPLRPSGGPYASGEAFFVRFMAANFLPRSTGFRPTREVTEQLRQALVTAAAGEMERSDELLASAAAEIDIEGFSADQVTGALMRNRAKLLPGLLGGMAQFRDVQRTFETLLRGSEAERAALIDGYPYDLRATTDDKPFFFDYFRFADFRRYSRNVRWIEAQDEFPVGHMVLASSLLQIAVLGLLLIVGPLLLVRRHGSATSGWPRYLVYFAALGVGYMLVEISLMQRFILFLGHPTYSLSLVLAAMLGFSGLGALASARIGVPSRRALTVLLAAIVVVVVAAAVLLGPVLEAAIGLSLGWRMLVAALLIAPAGFVLGFPFPLGVRLLERHAPVLIPWGWAVNGMLSVAASLLAVALAMAVGFSAVLLTAAAVYSVGLLAVPAGSASATG